MARNAITGEKRDILSLIVCAVFVLALGLFAFSGKKSESHQDRVFFFGSSDKPTEKPVLPKVMMPGGQ